jgi:predicted Zn-dependent protease with MMP-like domain
LYNTVVAFRVNREQFEGLLEEALERLPRRYKRYLTNIAITVEDYPTDEEKGRLTSKQELLLGLFSGTPYPGKGGFFDIPSPFPDRIILFQKNIEAISSSDEDLVQQIKATLVHEIGHYFGLSERELRKHEQ